MLCNCLSFFWRAYFNRSGQHCPPQHLDGTTTGERSRGQVDGSEADCVHTYPLKWLTSLNRFPRMYKDWPHIRGHLPMGILSTE